MVPLIYPYREVEYDDLPWWTRPWANPEDHKGGHASYAESLPKWWIDRAGIGFWSWYKYHALRNGANGLRSFEWFDLDIDPERVEFVTPILYANYSPWYMRKHFPAVKTYWHLTWQGWQAGFKFIHHWNDERHLEFKIGWRVRPRDKTDGIDPDGLRVRDAGFASKLLVYRKG